MLQANGRAAAQHTAEQHAANSGATVVLHLPFMVVDLGLLFNVNRFQLRDLQKSHDHKQFQTLKQTYFTCWL